MWSDLLNKNGGFCECGLMGTINNISVQEWNIECIKCSKLFNVDFHSIMKASKLAKIKCDCCKQFRKYKPQINSHKYCVVNNEKRKINHLCKKCINLYCAESKAKSQLGFKAGEVLSQELFQLVKIKIKLNQL